MELIHKYYKDNFNISDRDWEVFASKLEYHEFPKKQTILHEGQVENYLSFIETGLVRFYIPKEENELTFAFVFNHNFFSAYDSFLTQSPSKYRVETITDSSFWRISYNDLQAVYAETEIGNLIGRKASEELFIKKSERELSLLNKSPEERYLDLFSEKPEVIKEIPLKYIASYIGVTPQALSRIRKRIS